MLHQALPGLQEGSCPQVPVSRLQAVVHHQHPQSAAGRASAGLAVTGALPREADARPPDELDTMQGRDGKPFSNTLDPVCMTCLLASISVLAQELGCKDPHGLCI